MQNQVVPATVPTTVSTPAHLLLSLFVKIRSGVTPNTDNLSVALALPAWPKRQKSLSIDQKWSLWYDEKKKKASSTVACVSFRPLYLASIVVKWHLAGSIVPNFSKFKGYKGNAREHIARFIDWMGPFTHDAELCLWEFLKSLTGHVYTWYLNLMPWSINDWEHLVLVFNAKVFAVKQSILWPS